MFFTYDIKNNNGFFRSTLPLLTASFIRIAFSLTFEHDQTCYDGHQLISLVRQDSMEHKMSTLCLLH
jgi:hypothetical protein